MFQGEITRRELLAFSSLSVLGLTNVNAQESRYPNSPISMMVPYPAGGPSDIVARMVNTPLSKELGVPVIIENLGGASGAIGAQKALSAPANGQILYQGSPNEVIMAPLLNASVKYDAEDFQLIQLVSYAPLIVVVKASLPVNSMDELVALIRSSSKASKPLSYGSSGIGSFYHLLSEHLARLSNAQLTHVPYKGGAPLLQDLAAGNVDFSIMAHFAGIDGMASSGRVKILAQVGKTRAETLKNLPTIMESSSQLKDFGYIVWTGYMVKKGTPTPIVSKLQTALHSVISEPQMRDTFFSQNRVLAKPMTLDEAAQFYNEETKLYRQLVKAVGLERQ